MKREGKNRKETACRQRNLKRQKIYLGICASLLAAAMAVYRNGKGEKEEKRTDRIAAILPVEETNPFWNTVWNGVRDSARKNKVRLSEYQYDSFADDSVEDLLEIAVLSKIQGVILRASDYTSDRMIQLLEKAKEEGIRVILVDSDGEEQLRDGFVGVDNSAAGKNAAEVLMEQYMPERIFEIRNDGNPTSVTQREAGFQKWMSTLEEMPVISSVVLSGAEQVRYQTAQEVLKETQKGDAVVCFGANTTLIAAKTIERLNLQNQVFLMGFGESEEAFAYVESGEIDLLFAQENYEMGYQAMEAAFEMTGEGAKQPPENRYVKIFAVTKENAQKGEAL